VSRHVPTSEAAIARAVKRRIWKQPWMLRASCALGIEQVLASEVAELAPGVPLEVTPGAVRFEVQFDELYAALLRLRSADTIRIRIGDEAAASFPMARDHLARIPWALWLPRRCRVEVRIRAKGSRLRDGGGFERVVRQAIADHGIEASVASDAASVSLMQVRLELRGGRAEVWLDAAGEPLHRRRGQRWSAPTSLRETTAAALAVAGVPRDADLLYDPFCGSGTLLEEGASWLLNRCPGAHRSFALEASPAWSDARMRHARRTACPAEDTTVRLRLMGVDTAEAAVAAAHHNLELAGLREAAQVRLADARAVDPVELAARSRATRPVLLANPPYGRRAGAFGAEPDALVAQVVSAAAGFRFALLYPDGEALYALSNVTVERVVPVRMRGLRTQIITGDVSS